MDKTPPEAALPGAFSICIEQYSELVLDTEIEESAADIVGDQGAAKFGEKRKLPVEVVGAADEKVDAEFEFTDAGLP